MVAGALLLLSTGVMARSSDEQEPRPAVVLPEIPATTGALTPVVMVANARVFRKAMADMEEHVALLIQRARKERDIIKLNCLADKQSQILAHKEAAEESYLAMQREMDANNDSTAFVQYRRIAVANLNVQVMGTEADVCVGDDLAVVGMTRVDVVSEGVPTSDGTQPTTPSDPELVRPPHASPYY